MVNANVNSLRSTQFHTVGMPMALGIFVTYFDFYLFLTFDLSLVKLALCIAQNC